MAEPAGFDIIEEAGSAVLALKGDWTVDTIAALEADMRALGERKRAAFAIDVKHLGRMDVAGAYLVERTLRQSERAGGRAGGPDGAFDVRGEHGAARRLFEAARAAHKAPAPAPVGLHGFSGFVEGVGRTVAGIGAEFIQSLSFFGETLAVLARLALNPRRIRWVSVTHVAEHAGLDALPIIVMTSFFIGLVVAYLGARILGDFGASVFTVELVAFSVMREFAVVITAILLAGRTGSAFTAEIGAMKMRQEIDAMRVMGIEPMEALVAPRVVALVAMAPILTFGAVFAGLLGGLLACWAELGVSPVMFFTRIADGVPAQHFWVGLVKAPLMGLAVAVISCKQGLSVGGDVASLGARVTASVVQAIFTVILIDAGLAIWFLEMNL